MRYAEWLIRRRWLVLLASLMAVVALTAAAPRLIVTIKDIKAKEFRKAALRIDVWTREKLPGDMAAEASGPSLLFVCISDRNFRSMLTRTAVAPVLILLLLVFAFRTVGKALSVTTLVLVAGFAVNAKMGCSPRSRSALRCWSIFSSCRRSRCCSKYGGNRRVPGSQPKTLFERWHGL